MRAHALAFAIAALVSAIACVQFPERGPYRCSSNADCLGDEACVGGACRGPGGGAGSGGSGGSGGTGGCVKRTCGQLGCGLHQECGEAVECEPCPCTEQNFATVCPQRPCEVATGCVDAKCQYAPQDCGGLVCRPVTSCGGDDCAQFCTSAGCSDGMYACGPNDLCEPSTRFCDPRPDGRGGFGNACVGPLPASCGTCALGSRECVGNEISCYDLPHADGTIDCDSAHATSAFLYVDATRSPDGADGSRDHPYVDPQLAIEAAASRGAIGVVIGGSPVFHQPLVLHDGVSVYGGFGGAPAFLPDAAQYPVWEIDTSTIGDRTTATLLAGAVARDIVTTTYLVAVEVRTTDLGPDDATPAGQGWGNVALLAVNAPGLRVLDSALLAGAGAPGHDGIDAAKLPAEAVGGSARDVAPGAAPRFCKIPDCTGPTRRLCGSGGLGGGGKAPAEAGEAGDEKGAVAGGAAGRDARFDIACILTKFGDATTGIPGTDGLPGGDGSAGQAGRRSVLDPETGELLLAASGDGGTGTPGTWGSGGGAGGGHPDGCGCSGRCPGKDGGGAGAPGCGGLRGTAGGAGGPSIAVAALRSPGLSLLRTSLQTGDGGRGGKGGAGSDGAPGGGGETSGRCKIALDCPAMTPNIGGIGGNGGKGGRGGHAGGGAGGDSIPLLCSGGIATLESGGMSGGSPGDPGAGLDGNAGEAGLSELTLGCE